jgi:uncharacterized protein (TIGR00369 family)
MKEKLNNIENLKHIPTHLLDNNCFACGKNNPEGLHMKFYADEKYVFSNVYLTETKKGWEQIVHGGIISTILDEIMAWTAIYFTKQFMLTKTININYLTPLTIDSHVKAVGWIEEQKGNKEIIMKGQLYNKDNKLCAESTGNFALFSKKLAKRLKLMTPETIDQFDGFINALDNLKTNE